MSDHAAMRAAVLERVAALNGGDVERAEAWYSTCLLHELGGKTAPDYVAAGYGERVLRYVENLSAGATG